MANNNEILLAKMAEMLQQVVGTPASSEPVLSDFEIGLRKFFEEFGQPVGSALYIAERALKQASRNEQYDKELQANVLEKASEIKIIREEGARQKCLVPFFIVVAFAKRCKSLQKICQVCSL